MNARVDTIGHRALAHMEGLPPHTEISTGELGLAINVETNRLLHSLEALALAGKLQRRRRSDHPKSLWFWRVPSATPPAAPCEEEPAEHEPWPPLMPQVDAMRLPIGEATELGTILRKRAQITLRPSFSIRDGALHVQRTPDHTVTFTAPETQALIEWLARGLRVRFDTTLL